MVRTPEVDDSTERMEAHDMVGESKSSWVVTCKKRLEDNIRVHGVKSEDKYSKRETEQKVKKNVPSTAY